MAGFCTGCGRTVLEVVGWAAMPLLQRQTVEAALPARLAQRRLVMQTGPLEEQ